DGTPAVRPPERRRGNRLGPDARQALRAGPRRRLRRPGLGRGGSDYRTRILETGAAGTALGADRRADLGIRRRTSDGQPGEDRLTRPLRVSAQALELAPLGPAGVALHLETGERSSLLRAAPRRPRAAPLAGERTRRRLS